MGKPPGICDVGIPEGCEKGLYINFALTRMKAGGRSIAKSRALRLIPSKKTPLLKSVHFQKSQQVETPEQWMAARYASEGASKLQQVVWREITSHFQLHCEYDSFQNPIVMSGGGKHNAF